MVYIHKKRCVAQFESLITPDMEDVLEHSLALFDIHFKWKIIIPYEIYTFQTFSKNLDETKPVLYKFKAPLWWNLPWHGEWLMLQRGFDQCISKKSSLAH